MEGSALNQCQAVQPTYLQLLHLLVQGEPYNTACAYLYNKAHLPVASPS